MFELINFVLFLIHNSGLLIVVACPCLHCKKLIIREWNLVCVCVCVCVCVRACCVRACVRVCVMLLLNQSVLEHFSATNFLTVCIMLIISCFGVLYIIYIAYNYY